METKRVELKKEIKIIFSIFLLVALCYILLPITILNNEFTHDNFSTLKTIMLVGIGICVFFFIKDYYEKKLNYKKFILYLFLMSSILKIGYGIYTNIWTRQHDVGNFGEDGHLGYIWTIFQNFKLPSTNNYQFYQPPLHHIISALFIMPISIWIKDPIILANSIRILTTFYSCITLYYMYRLLKELNLSKIVVLIAFAVLAFHPTFILLSPSINNDGLALLFYILGLYYTVKWYKIPSIKNIIFIALFIGLGMMCKLSVATLTPITAVIFLIKWIKEIKNHRWKPLLFQFLLFAILCIPLGMFFPLRNYFLFNQPIGYVWNVTNMELYTGNYNLFERFIFAPFSQLIGNFYCNVGTDYNIPIYLFKSSIFGEYSFYGGFLFALFLMIFNFFLILISTFGFVISLKKKARSSYGFAKMLLIAIYVIQIGMFLKFNLDYPFGCTMDFRYVIPILLPAALFVGIAYEKSLKNSNTPLKYFINVSLLGFIFSTIAFYCTCI